MHRKARIAGTLGPACDDEAVLAGMIDAGMQIARLNFSHGTIEDHRRRVVRLRRVARRQGSEVALLADLQGPRFRVGRLDGGGIVLVEGGRVPVIAGALRSRAGTIPVAYAALARDVRRGGRILLDDGRIELRVERIRGETLICSIVRGGTLTDHKGINLPGAALSVPTLTRKDRADLRAAVELGADWLAISFVRSAQDVRDARRLLRRAGSDAPVMAKIERSEAIDELDSIVDEADGILVARGDLGVELPPEEVPVLQKRMVETANRAGKPVMTATQMLESMRHERRPTRAEASDVANAVLDGSTSLLLTAETAAGRYPVEAVKMMARIVERTETSCRAYGVPRPADGMSIPIATCLAAVEAAADVDARAIVVFTESGYSARQIARFRPLTPIVAFTPNDATRRRMNLLWGVDPRRLARQRTVDALMRALDRALLAHELAGRGETVAVVGGAPIGRAGTTNYVFLHRVGEYVSRRGS